MASVTIIALPKSAVEEDHRLEKAASGANVALMKLRWHWTADEANAKRVSYRQYARDVGRGESVVRKSVTAYDLVRTHGRAPEDALERARLGSETYEATRAFAEARGIATATARDTHSDEVRSVRDLARERAEQKGTTIEQEVKSAAEWVVKADSARDRDRSEKLKRHGLVWSKTEGKLQDAKRKVVEAIDVALGAEFDREERDLLLHTIGEVEEGLHLAKMAVAGKSVADKKLELLRGGLSA